MSLFNDYMKYTAPFGGSKIYHRWAIISVLSALQERRTWYPMGGLGRIFPNMYILLIGPAGSGKTVAGDLAVGLVRKYNRITNNPSDHLFMAPDKITPARLLTKLKESYHTAKDQSYLFQYATELSASILDIGGGSLIPDLLKLFDCNETFQKETQGSGILDIKRPCFNLLGCTTTNFLSSFMSRDQVGTGLAARIVFASDFSRYKFKTTIPKGDKNLWQNMLGQVQRVHCSSGEFKITPDAVKFFDLWHEKVQDDLWNTPDDTFMRDYVARKAVQVRKIAMALSVARDSSLTIVREDFSDAINYLEELEPNLSRCFGTTDSRAVLDYSRQILNKVPTHKTISRPALIQALYHAGIGGRLSDLLDNISLLVESGMLREIFNNHEPEYIRISIDE